MSLNALVPPGHVVLIEKTFEAVAGMFLNAVALFRVRKRVGSRYGARGVIEDTESLVFGVVVICFHFSFSGLIPARSRHGDDVELIGLSAAVCINVSVSSATMAIIAITTRSSIKVKASASGVRDTDCRIGRIEFRIN
jgi:hypothetical protein